MSIATDEIGGTKYQKIDASLLIKYLFRKFSNSENSDSKKGENFSAELWLKSYFFPIVDK
jgi:hypothetical protein